MENFLYFYRDPLFGIIIFVAIIATIALFDYSRNKYRIKQKNKSLEDLAKSYEYTSLNEDIIKIIQNSQNSLEPLMLMAKSYAQSGNSENAIQIYLSALESIKNSKQKIQILEALGQTYLQAGFLQRAKDIFTQILKSHPRNPEVLKSLMQTYEKMGEYQKAIEVLECLNEAQGDFSSLQKYQTYFYLMTLLQSHLIPLQKKIKNAIIISKAHLFLERMVLKFLKSNDPKSFWELAFKAKETRNYIDLFFSFEKEKLPDQIYQHHQIFEIFVAKGYFESNKPCEVFELEVLRCLQKSNKEISLAFEYRCNHCKKIFPFDSVRCPDCGELDLMDLILKPIEVKRSLQ